jgi:hypothetical protein
VVSGNWLNVALQRVVGNGSSTFFWLSNWIGEAPLARLFPQLYSLSNHKENMVDHFGVRNGDTCSWSFSCRRELFAWENDLVVQLKDRLALVRLVLEEDVWRSLPDLEGIFSVKSTYLLLENSLRTSEELGEEALVFFIIFGRVRHLPKLSRSLGNSFTTGYRRD